ncbi:MAG: 1,4-dihydroxy-6-naphthoate synthase [Prevotellaceae bacterium]|jgi:1,4-dihydroxy-6-naphthoate synthase|nr:1,4-dihydroxy-6-naphthoate synthase [Prevotellaceae bacterium]
MKLTLAISTCPNDTFVFDALVHHKIDTEGLTFDLHLADVEELNKLALEASVDITKLSYHAYAYVAKDYLILSSGGALGRGNGPLFVSKKKIYPDEVGDITVAIPGKRTTAAMLLRLAFPSVKRAREYLFSDIESAILDNEADAGVLIHEGRFTYRKKGLRPIADLGEWWENESNQPIPLGNIAIKRGIPSDVRAKFDRVLRRSVEFALNNPKESSEFVRRYAREMDEDVMRKHIALFVNQSTVDLGDEGRKAVQVFFDAAREINAIPELPEQIFNFDR